MKERVSEIPLEQGETALTAREYVKGLSLAQLEDIALEVLSEALQTVSPKNEPELAMKLANATLDRTRGKPAQSMAMEVKATVEVQHVTPLESARRVAFLLAQGAIEGEFEEVKPLDMVKDATSKGS